MEFKSSLIQNFVCPLCGNGMKVEESHDGVQFLKCIGCRSHIHFGSWEAQRAIIDGEDINFVFWDK